MLQEYELKSTVHLLGLVALFFSLLGMTMKNILTLRIFSASGNFIYIIYGLLIGAPPLIIGGAIVVVIHGYHIHKLVQNNGEKRSN
jgi:hypothetical protein